MKGRIKSTVISGLLILTILLELMAAPVEVQAFIKTTDAFQNAYWEYQDEVSVVQAAGWLQSMCATENYIICLENNADNQPDTLIAFYKNPYDENGNPVQQYSYAKHITETDYEHGNGMTYYAPAHELVIAGAKPTDPENMGVLFITDADSLQLKRKVKVTDDRIIAVDYAEEFDQYVLAVRKGDSYEFVTTDTDFNILGTMMPIEVPEGNALQDFCVSGDYILSLSSEKKGGAVHTLQVYSLENQALMGTYGLGLGTGGNIEPESICELSEGHIMIASALTNPRRIRFYTTQVAVAYSITTSVEHGTVTSSQGVVDQGTQFTVKYAPDEDYELKSVVIDGQPADIAQYPTEYVFENLQADHTVDVEFKEIPKFPISTNAVNGTIEPSMEIRRDKDVTIHYEPDEHYEIEALLVDGQLVEPKGNETEYTLTNIQGPHTVDVRFKEIPSFTISTEAENGTITPANPEVYRDDYYTVEYQPKEGYDLAHVIVDGQELDQIHLEDEGDHYTFKNVQGAHSIKVVYQWTYMPLLLFVEAMLIAWLVALIVIHIERRKKRILKRKKRRYHK